MPKKETDPKRNDQGQWPKGKSGNPSGRPAGSRNKATLWLEELMEGEAEAITRKVIDQAKAGDALAQRLCMERIYPPRKERLIHLPLPHIQTAQEAAAAISQILTAIGNGEITPGEGETLALIVEAQKRTSQAEDWERRMSELEKTVRNENGGRK